MKLWKTALESIGFSLDTVRHALVTITAAATVAAPATGVVVPGNQALARFQLGSPNARQCKCASLAGGEGMPSELCASHAQGLLLDPFASTFVFGEINHEPASKKPKSTLGSSYQSSGDEDESQPTVATAAAEEAAGGLAGAAASDEGLEATDDSLVPEWIKRIADLMRQTTKIIDYNDLKDLGWQWKKGTSRDVLSSYYYFPPEAPKISVPSNSLIGVSHFASEESAVAFAIEMGQEYIDAT